MKDLDELLTEDEVVDVFQTMVEAWEYQEQMKRKIKKAKEVNKHGK